jgi:shikimate kinase
MSTKPGTLIATGGGAVLRPGNRRILTERGFVIWLQTSVDQQLKRLELDRQRPLLQTPDKRARLEQQAQQRNPLYAEVADLAFRSGDHSARYMARELVLRLQALWADGEETRSRAAH